MSRNRRRRGKYLSLQFSNSPFFSPSPISPTTSSATPRKKQMPSNQSSKETERVEAMKQTWRAWAKQANVLPWPRDRRK
jgi:hypothetical protein